MYRNSTGLVKERWVKSGVKPRQETILPIREDDEVDRLFLLTANNTIRKAIDSRLDGIELHAEIRSFLHDHWSRLLRKIFNRDGAEGAAWQHGLNIIDDMVNYIITCQTPGLEQGQNETYHSVERRFRNGLKNVVVPEPVCEVFFARLADYSRDVPGMDDKPAPAVPFGAELLVDNKKLKR